MNLSTPQVVIFIAPPGAGKGTQADILAQRKGFLHLETAQIIEEKFAKADSDDAEIQKEKENFLTGKLVTPEKVTAWVIEKIYELASRGTSIVFSGSFRTLYEAQQEIPVIEKLYGRDRIKIFYITLSEKESVRRNANRRICEKNRHPIPNLPEFQNLTVCPQDGSPLIKRSLDVTDVIRKRYREYQNRTEPVLNYFREQNYSVVEINGEQTIERVAQDIAQHFQKPLHSSI